MYRVSKIKELSSLIGWRQNFDTTGFQIDPTLTVSDSGQYYQDIHPLLTLDNVKSIAPEFNRIDFPDWNLTTTFTQGTRVDHNGGTYLALTTSTGIEPGTDTNTWRLFDAFSDWLKQKTEASIVKAIKTVYTERIKEKAGKSLIESKPLFDGAARIGNLIANTSNFVGFEIIPIRGFGVTLKIDKIGTQFSGGIEDLTLYVMHSSQNDPVQTITLQRTKDKSSEWFTPDTDIYLPYSGNSADVGGSWYIIYDQNALGAGVQAISKEKDWSKRPCNGCNRKDYDYWRSWSRYLEIHPFRTNETSSPVSLWDIESNLYTYSTNYGLNLQVSVHCDISDLIVEQSKSFETLIGLQVAADFIREMAYNPEYNINRTQQNFSRMELLYELDGDSTSVKKTGLKYELETAMKAVTLDLDKMSRVCFSCDNGGVRYKTATG